MLDAAMPRTLHTKTLPDPLTDAVKAEFLARHIPYRLELLRLGKASCPARDMCASAIVEAGVVSGRLLLQFLGLGIELRPDPRLVERHDYFEKPKGQTDEVKVPDLGGSFVDLSELSDEDKLVLAEFHYGASKACAHFTWESEHGLDVEIIHRASDLIDGLVHAHCPVSIHKIRQHVSTFVTPTLG
jgi:hypothetical protein